MQFPSSFSVSCRSTFLQSSFPILLNHSWTSSARLKLSVKVEIRSPGAGLSTPALDNKAHPIMKETLNWFTDWGTLGLSFSHRLAGARGLAWKNAEEPEFHEAAVLTGSLRVEEWMRKHGTPVPWLTHRSVCSRWTFRGVWLQLQVRQLSRVQPWLELNDLRQILASLAQELQ